MNTLDATNAQRTTTAKAKPATATNFMSAGGWIAAAAVVAIVFYQFPKSRGYLSGLIVLVVIGMTLRNYDTIRKELLTITKG